MKAILTLLFCALTLWGLKAQDYKPSKAERQALDQLTGQLVGVYDNTRHAELNRGNPLYNRQLMRIQRIWPKRKQENWLYLGWFHPDIDNMPLAARLVKLELVQGGNIVLRFFEIPNPEGFCTEWEASEPFAALRPEQLDQADCACTANLSEDKSTWQIRLDGQPCQSGNPLAPYTYQAFNLNLKGTQLSLFNVFYDEQMRELFRYEGQGNVFERQGQNGLLK